MMKLRIALPLFSTCLALSALAQAQTPALPDLPAPPSATPATKPSFQLPKSPTGAPAVVAHSSGPAPASQEDDVPFCSALSETNFRFDKPLTLAQNKEMKDFLIPLLVRISADWHQRIPRIVSDAWQKNKVLLVRFDIDHAGTVTNEELMLSSGRGLHDKAALKAIADAAPLPLPAELPEPAHLCVSFHYIYTPQTNKRNDPLEQYEHPLKPEDPPAAPPPAPGTKPHT